MGGIISLSDSGPYLYTLTLDEDDWHLASVLLALDDADTILSCLDGTLGILCTIADSHAFDI